MDHRNQISDERIYNAMQAEYLVLESCFRLLQFDHAAGPWGFGFVADGCSS